MYQHRAQTHTNGVPGASPTSQEFKAGEKAYVKGLPLSDNPFKGAEYGSDKWKQSQRWLAGYAAAGRE